MNKKNITQHNHYVPQFYLKGFESKPDCVWQFDSHQNTFVESGVRVLANKKNLYTSELDDGEKTDDIEEMLMEADGQFSTVLKDVQTLVEIDNVQRSFLAFFASVQFLRTLKSKDAIDELTSKLTKKMYQIKASDKAYFDQMVEETAKEKPELRNIDKEAIRKYAIEGNYDISFSNNHFFQKQLLERMHECAKIIHGASWYFLHSPRGSEFVTSDDPFTMRLNRKKQGAFDGPGLLVPGTQIILPLNKKVCMLVVLDGDQSFSVQKASKQTVRKINQITMNNIYRFAYGSNKSLLESLAKNTNIHKKRPLERLVKVG